MQKDTANWSICSLCAYVPTPHCNYSMTPFQSKPSRSGIVEMYADGPQWTNVLFMM